VKRDTAKPGVLFISSAEWPGADTFIHMLIMRHLDRQRFDVHIAGPGGESGVQSDGYRALAAIPDVRLREMNFGPSMFYRSALGKLAQVLGIPATILSFLRMARYIRSQRITVLHATDRPRDAVACAILGKLTGAKSIVHVHLKCASWMGRPLRWAMGQVDALAGISRFVTSSLHECGYSPGKTHTVLNAIDVTRWDPTIDPDPVRQEFAIPPGAPVVACAGRLFPGKGHGAVVRAIAALRQEFPDIRLLITGRDDFQVMRTSYTEELKALAASLGISEHIVFTGHRSDMPQIFAACDVFALPSFEEPFGLVYLEAMAMKKPAIALGNGGAVEVVEPGRNGLLVNPEQPQELATHLATLLRDAALRARMGEYGRRQVEARFTAQRMAADFARLYEELTSHHASAQVVEQALRPARR
jgi:glycosyltransferase involved in cell wall biosynthesis